MSPDTKLNRNRVWTCVLINQFATPGLGSLLCRRILSGTGQLVLAIAGFALLIDWMWQYFYRSILQQLDKPVSHASYAWMGKWGLICFGAGWLWSLLTSLSLLRQAEPSEQAPPDRLPPRISGEPPPGDGR